VDLFAGDAGAQLKCGGEFGCLGQAQPFFLGQLGHRHAAQCAHRPVFGDQVAADVDRTVVLDARGNKQRHQFGIVEGRRPQQRQFFPRPLVKRHVLDALTHGACQANTNFHAVESSNITVRVGVGGVVGGAIGRVVGVMGFPRIPSRLSVNSVLEESCPCQ